MTLITNQTCEVADLVALAEQTKEYISQAKSINTRKAYKTDWQDFVQWCRTKKLNPMPAKPEMIAAYLSDRAKNLKVSSLERRLVAIRQAHAMAGYPLDKGNAIVSETFKGIKNIHGAPQIAKAPILIEDLRAMVQKLDNSLAGTRDKALLLLGFTGAFRRSELVGLMFEDLRFTKEGIEVLLRRSKTDQIGKGEILPIPYGSNPDTCPVRVLKSWLEMSGIQTGYLFRAINKHGYLSEKGMCPASVALIIKRNSHLEGKENSYSGHSLRAGFCTTAAAKGVPEHAIMRQSRHKKSDTVKKYIRIANMWQDCAATKLGL